MKAFLGKGDWKGLSHWMKERRKLLWVVAGVFGLFLGITLLLFLYQGDERQFTQVTQKLFRDEMLGNTLNMHYTVADPKNFGIFQYEAVLPGYAKDRRLESKAQVRSLLKFLDTVDPKHLDDEKAYTYELLHRAMENAWNMSEYAYFEEPLAPASGMQSQLPILLAEYTFRSKQDVEDYLALLDQTDTYFDSLVQFEKEKSEVGLFMSASTLDQVLEQCELILNQQDLKDGNHFLQTTFVERLGELYEEGVLTKEEAKYYIAQNNRLLSTVVAPAYEALYDGLFVLEDEEIPLAGLASKPGGAAYYELLLQSETGSSRSVSEIKQILKAKLEEEFRALRDLLTFYPQLALVDYSNQLKAVFPVHTASQMLLDLQERMVGDFPKFEDVGNGADTEMGRQRASADSIPTEKEGLTADIGAEDTDVKVVVADKEAMTVDGEAVTVDGEAVTIDGEAVTIDEKAMTVGGEAVVVDEKAMTVDGKAVVVDRVAAQGDEALATAGASALPSVTVKEVSKSLENYCAPAYYLTPPIDDSDNNVIYINEKNSPVGLELYTTLAHEGYPGHLYQTVYSNRKLLGQEDNLVRQILWYGGYQEGWAMYVEMKSFDYAGELLEENGHGELVPEILLEQHNRSLLLCLYSLLDIMIHYENASYDEVREVLNNCGITQESSVLAVYSYLVEEPANYLKYYLGYLEILDLKEEAKTLWGDGYSDYAFHKFFLDCGPSDFTTVREALQKAKPNESPSQKRESDLLSLFYIPPAKRMLAANPAALARSAPGRVYLVLVTLAARK